MTTISRSISKGSRHLSATWLKVALIAAVWGLTHIWTLHWGLPALQSPAPDSALAHAELDSDAMMFADLYRYPPLQFLIWDSLSPADKALEKDDSEAYLMATSHRYVVFRVVVACMMLGSTLLVFYLCQRYLAPGWYAVLAALLFLLNPLSLYYGQTTNMDQPYLFWFLASIAFFCLGNVPRAEADLAAAATGKKRRKQERQEAAPRPGAMTRRWWLGNSLFAVAMACSFCTKDQVYGLYIMPLALYVLYRGVRARAWREAGYLCLLWTGAFTLTMMVIYRSGGGVSTLQRHLSWITGRGKDEFVQVGGGLLGRLRLVVSSVQNLAVALDWPLLVLVLLVGGLILARRGKLSRLVRDGALRWLLVGLAAMLVSYELFFIQVTRFGYERFYIAFVPGACLLVAAGLYACRDMRWQRGVWAGAIGLALLDAALGGQTLHRLANLPQDQVRERLPQLVSSSGESSSVGLVGCEWGRAFGYSHDQPDELRVIRDWTDGMFGYVGVAKTKSVLADPFFLWICHPDLLVSRDTTPDQHELFRQTGYELIQSFESPEAVIPGWFKQAYSSMQIYRLERWNSTMPEVARSYTLADQTLILLTSLDAEKKNAVSILKQVGEVLQPFDPAKLNGVYATDYSLCWLGVAYAEVGRLAEAEQAYRLMLTRTDRPELIRNWHVFCKRYGVDPNP